MERLKAGDKPTPLFSDAPFVVLLLPAVIGILTGNESGRIPSGWLGTISVTWFLFYLLARIKGWLSGFPFTEFLMFMAILWMFWCRTIQFNGIDHPLYFGNTIEASGATNLVVEALETNPPKNGKIRWSAEVKAIMDDTSYKTANGFIMIYSPESKKIVAGNWYLIRASIRRIESMKESGTFDWKRFCALRRIHFQARLFDPSDLRCVKMEQSVLNQVRKWSKKVIEDHLPGKPSRALISAMLLGDKSGLTPEFRRVFSQTGVMHILAVSGLHVGIIYLLMTAMMKPLHLIGIQKTWIMGITVLAIWSFALLTGLSSSVARAAFMFSLISLGKGMGRSISIYNILAASAFILLFIDPLKLFYTGFQLSYIAVAGIASIFPLLRVQRVFSSAFMQKIFELGCVTVAAQVATCPISLHTFGSFPNYFLITNYLAIPAATVLVIGGILVLTVSAVPIVNDALGIILDVFIRLFYSTMEWFADLPYRISQWKLNSWDVIGCYVFLSMLVIAMHTGSKRLFFSGLIVATIHIAVKSMDRIIALFDSHI